MISELSCIFFIFLLHSSESSRDIKFINNCNIPIWVSPRSNPDSKSNIPATDIRKILPGNQVIYNIQDAGWAGRFWPKAGCNNAGHECSIGQSENPCPTNGCTPPAETIAEFYFGRKDDKSASGENFYDISLVDGYSFPVTITPQRKGSFPSCTETRCALSRSDCPSNENDGIGNLRLASGQCIAPCKKVTYPTPTGLGQPITSENGQQYCCPTPPITVEQCRNGRVVNSKYVKAVQAKCPSAYSFAYDDTNGLHKCENDVGFTVRYCS